MQLDFKIGVPGWVADFVGQSPRVFPTMEDRMRFVIALARQNIERQSGGPFGAGVFDEQGRLVAPGVNIVVTRNCSILHAEIVAIALAQKELGRYDISDGGKSDYELVTSTEPCAMCSGLCPGRESHGWCAAPEMKMRGASDLTRGRSFVTGNRPLKREALK